MARLHRLPPETITRDARGRATVRAIKLTRAAAARRQARRRGLPRPPSRSAVCSRWRRIRRRVDRALRRLGDVRRDQHLRLVPMLGFGAAGALDRQRAAPRHQPAAQQRSLRRDVRHLLRSPERLHVLHEPARRARRLLGRRRGQSEHRLESGVGARTRARFEGGWTVEMAIPFKSLRYRSGTGPGLGHPAAPRHPPQERVDVPDAGAAEPGRAAGAQSRLVRRHAGRPRSAAGEQELRAQAVRDLAAHDRPRRAPRRSTTTSIPTSAAT